MKNTTRFFVIICMVTNVLLAQQKPNQKISIEKSSISLETLITQKSNNYVITNEYVSKKTGIRHIYLRQAIDGIEVKGTESSIHFDVSGTVIISHNNFIENIPSTVLNKTVALNASQAITSVANQMHYSLDKLETIESLGGINKKAIYNKAGISLKNIPVKLMYYLQKDIGTTMVWELSIAEKNASDWWVFHVDAASGVIIDKDNLTISCNILGDHEEHPTSSSTINHTDFIGPIKEIHSSLNNYSTPIPFAPTATYNVYAMPTESPNYGPRTLVTNPENLSASPFGWHDTNGVEGAEFTSTVGNNVSAYDDDDANNLPDDKYAYSPGGSLIFDFPLNTTYSAGDQSENAILTNLFYWNNIVHDVLYEYGFDEAAGNFQENNYGNAGLGGDSVNAQAQDGSATCNAFFSTPVDGTNPTMRMHVCNSRDSDIDNGVIIHEYGHGISNRLTGGSLVGCLANTEQMGEGWSDFYGLLLTMKSGDTGEDSRPIGTWLLGESASGLGFRTYPYSTLLTTNPHTYDDIKTEVIPHGIGSVWTAMLWDMTWSLIEDQGFDANFYTGTGGNNIALNLVTQGLILQPCSPGFIDGRDAILAADQTLYGGAYQCLIWEAFAKRGLGFSASQGSSSSRSDGTEAFDLPTNYSSFKSVEEICMASGIQTGLSGGLPTGGVYSGIGVTDTGDGLTYSFDPNVTGVGMTSVNYYVNDYCTGVPATLTEQINVTNNPPELIIRGSGLIPLTQSLSNSPALSIPDGNTTGITDTFTVANNVIITDLNVDLDISHTYVGDLIVTIKSPSGTTATLIDRPGVPASTYGCLGNNILATFDDEATTPVETACDSSEPTINGLFIPENPLSIFDGENTSGIWEIFISDSVSQDVGTLNSWGITFGYEVLATPLDVFLDASGNATINAEDLLFSNSIDCGTAAFTGGNPLASTISFSCLDLGVNNVDVLVSNNAGASTSGVAIVHVIDNLNPSAIAQDITVNLEGNSSVSITANDIDNGSTDNCDFTLSINVDTFTEVGNYPVILSITDSSGHQETFEVNVEVIDVQLSAETFNEIEKQITIYPVPTTATLNISTELTLDTIEIFDVLGKQILHIKKPSNKIDVSHFSEGLYIIQFQVENKTVIKRFIKH
ncbi:M36 family metallopeptidase [Lacinutrix himadriensis]|uniref:M36 family metallopeptidase n=1 Tax=Lacinutrix himadriensis TaxID=641549 RepID=UPI000A7A1D16|nr:M36 family metallopeptidase [Lacinutrix himadriensis]